MRMLIVMMLIIVTIMTLITRMVSEDEVECLG
jgi:hypothetical protein